MCIEAQLSLCYHQGWLARTNQDESNHVRRFRNEQQIARKGSHQYRYFHGDLFYRHFRCGVHRFYPDFHSAYQRDRAACGRYSDDVVLLQN